MIFPGGRTPHWELVKAGADGWFSDAALRGGYVASTFSAPKAAVMILEASADSLVYVDHEPRAGETSTRPALCSFRCECARDKMPCYFKRGEAGSRPG